MPLTPADVHNVAFKKPPIGKRGYDDEEVDAFLDLVEAELARLIEENADLRAQVADLEGQLAGAPPRSEEASSSTGQYAALVENAPPADEPVEEAVVEQTQVVAAPPSFGVAPTAAPMADDADEHVQASRILALATETADRFVSEAKQKAASELSEAEAKAEELRTAAKSNHDEMIAKAKAEAESHLTDVRSNAASLLSDSQTKAAAMERAAQERAHDLTSAAERKQADILRALDERKSALERRIEGLTEFESAYRTRMHGYLTSQLKHIDELPSLNPADGNGPIQVSGFVGSDD